MAKMEHFEIPVAEMDRARAFYENVLGYDYQPWDEQQGMLRPRGGEGVGGDLHMRGETVTHPTVVFTVDRIEDAVAAAVAHGGEQIGEISPLTETARWVYIRDSEGNVIGLYDDTASD